MELAVYQFLPTEMYSEAVATVDAAGYRIVSMDGTQIADRKTLMAAVSERLLTRTGYRARGWDALADMLWEEIGVEESVAIVWTRCDVLLHADTTAFMTAFDVFTGASRQVYEHSQSRTALIAIYLGEGFYRPDLQRSVGGTMVHLMGSADGPLVSAEGSAEIMFFPEDRRP